MIPVVDRPEVAHNSAPLLRIDMTKMDEDSIRTMLEQSRDGFYSNKELAPVREYSTNARDSHIEAGIPTRPIEITLPSLLSPELRIRDFGGGLNLEKISDVYFKYWKSTKRNSNETNGCLGIGAKSAFAYTAMYTIVTWSEGMKTIVTGQKNGYADVIFHEKNTENEPNGVEVIIPIQQKDIEKFIHEALQFFKYWDIRPIFHNIEADRLTEAFNLMDVEPFLHGDGWAVRPAGHGRGSSRAVMSSVPYQIDWEQVRNGLRPEIFNKISGMFTFLEENITTLHFPNGTLSFTPNRETLQYNDTTISHLSDKLVAIYTNLLKMITDKIAGAENLWEAKIAYNRIFRRELDGFDKGVFYGGNLSTLEDILSDAVEWRGIPISNGYFEGMDNWDVNHGQECLNDFEPVFSTFVKDTHDDSIKMVKTRRYSSARIIASPRSVVIIQDVEKDFLAKGFAKWYLNECASTTRQVYVLKLTDATVKDEFFDKYSFETVPVVYVSENIDKIKAYLKSIRAKAIINPTGEKRPLNCPYVEMSNRRQDGSSYIYNTNWGYENVNARGIEGGGVFVVYSKDGFSFGEGKFIRHCNAKEFWQAVYEFGLIAGKPLTKVYGIHPKVVNSTWFQEAIKEGAWTSLEKWIDDNYIKLPLKTYDTVKAYRDTDFNRMGIVLANRILPELKNQDGVAAKYAKLISDYNKYLWVCDIPCYFRREASDSNTKATKRFEAMNSELREKYPLMFRIMSRDLSNLMVESPENNRLDKDLASEILNYINLIDTAA